jgi:hypothetical protein
MKYLLGIKKVTVLTELPGTDRVTIHTDLPSPFPIGVGNDYLIMDFEVQKGKGITYVKNNFGNLQIVLEQINCKTGEHRVL